MHDEHVIRFSLDFLCMNAMHTLVFSHFIISKPEILQHACIGIDRVVERQR
jgi:hypothetical protein